MKPVRESECPLEGIAAVTESEKGQIREFIAEQVGGIRIDDDEDLFDGGHVNSLFAVQLVMWIERALDVPVERGDLDVDNFRTVDDIAAFVDRKREPAWTSD
jgi:methoxymalonate biosynthesis acyl carrier protein